jgi:hypothetical protein
MLLPQWLELALSIGAGLAIGAVLLTLWAMLKRISRSRSVPGDRVP